MKVRYHALARNDVLEILTYYEQEAGTEIAARFFAEMERGIRRISKNPHSFPEIAGGVRRCLLDHFPYQINYEIIATSEVKILVIRHQRRSPDFGLDR